MSNITLQDEDETHSSVILGYLTFTIKALDGAFSQDHISRHTGNNWIIKKV